VLRCTNSARVTAWQKHYYGLQSCITDLLASCGAQHLGLGTRPCTGSPGASPWTFCQILMTRCPVREKPRGARRERVAAAHHGADQGRGVRVLCQDSPGGAATCPEMGSLPSAGQGHVGRAPLLAIPRLAYVLPLPEVAHHRVCRHRLARGVHYLSVARREERV
jgi:hypothetical protein